MTTAPYPTELLHESEDDGTMPENVTALATHVVGHRIVRVDRNVPRTTPSWSATTGTVLTLDNGKRVMLADTEDCCAHTELEDVTLNLDRIEHVILGVGTTDDYGTWHLYADLGDVMTMKVGWSCGNPFYYGYGFDIQVTAAPTEEA